MTLRGLLCVLLVAFGTGAPSSSAQSKPSAAASSGSTKENISLLLARESEALAHFQQVLAPGIRCDQGAKEFRQTCHDMVAKLKDEAQQAQRDIAQYRASDAGQPADLFDIYDQLQFLLKDIEILSIEDEYNGDGNHHALAESYNGFVKLTGVWFSGEMRKVILALSR
ncbi:MAG TPA: hypothetical protein VKH81_04160 [Candidatus Angelobacter sp.]|nr:hypothetical protein [Candidatus Angelobacter sp.]